MIGREGGRGRGPLRKSCLAAPGAKLKRLLNDNYLIINFLILLRSSNLIGVKVTDQEINHLSENNPLIVI